MSLRECLSRRSDSDDDISLAVTVQQQRFSKCPLNSYDLVFFPFWIFGLVVVLNKSLSTRLMILFPHTEVCVLVIDHWSKAFAGDEEEISPVNLSSTPWLGRVRLSALAVCENLQTLGPLEIPKVFGDLFKIRFYWSGLDCMVLYGFAWYYMVLIAIAWYSKVFTWSWFVLILKR